MSQVAEVGPCRDQSSEIRRLESVVRNRLNGRLRHFQMLMFSDGLVLQGEAHTYYAKQLAQHVIMEMTELPILANDIIVIS